MKCIGCGKELTTVDGYDLYCRECKKENENKQHILYGWICPRCGTVHSPFVIQCSCAPPTVTKTGICDND